MHFFQFLRRSLKACAPMLCTALVVQGLTASRAAAQSEDRIAFQGYLEQDGSPLDGATSLTFRVYTAESGGAAVWEQTHTDVGVEEGVFTTYLGGTEAFRDIPWGTPLFVSVARGDASAPEIGERIPLAAVPYAMAVRGLRVISTSDDDSPNVVGGWSGNTVSDAVQGATIAGGGEPLGDLEGGVYPNEISANYGTVGGGYGNEVSGARGTIAGGAGNQAAEEGTTVGGGGVNRATARGSTIAGGFGNEASEQNASVGGGQNNRAQGRSSYVGGGSSNWSTGAYAAIAGGIGNTAGGSWSFAGGRYTFVRDAEASTDDDGDEGTFVWSTTSDAENLDRFNSTRFESTGPDQFLVNVPGGVGINTNRPRGTVSIARTAQAAEYQLELRNEGSIRSPNFDGLVFTHGTEGATPLAAMQVLYRNNGFPDLALNLRSGSTTLGTRLMLRSGGDVLIPSNGAMLQFGGPNDASAESIGYLDAGGSFREAMQFRSGNVVALSNRAANGVVAIKANGATAGAGGEADVAEFQDDRIVLLKRVGIFTAVPTVALDVNGTARAVDVELNSDARLKRDVAPIAGAASLVERLRGVTYRWRRDEFPERDFSDDLQYGLIAQEVRDVLPDLVTEDANGMLSVSYVQLIPVLIEALREQDDEVDGLRTALGQQQVLLGQMQAELARLSEQVAGL